MHKFSSIILALLLVSMLAALVMITGCKEEPKPSAQIARDLFPNGNETTTVPVAPDTTPAAKTPPVTATKTPPPAKPPAQTPAEKMIPAVAKTGHYTAPTDKEVAAAKAGGTRKAIIKTERGEMVAELYGKDAPMTVANFIKLAQAHFYDGLYFHRVVPGFCIQGGDPQGTGGGGPGYSIKLEIAPTLKHVDGALAMARANDPNSAGSQFYVCLGAQPNLDGQYAVFGKVITGLDVSKKIAVGDKIVSVTIQ